MSGRVLVVDDNPDAADSMAALIQVLGYETEVAYSGPQAIDRVAAFQPDMVLLDISMPGMDGYAAAANIRQKAKNLQTIIVAVTGWTREEDKRRAYEAGFDLHATKPMEFGQVKELLSILGPVQQGAAS